MYRNEDPPAFKVGQIVCFQLPEKKGSEKYWNIGSIVALPTGKVGMSPIAEVCPYELPELSRSQTTDEEWSCLDPLRIDLTREMLILNILSSQSQVTLKKSSKVVRIPVADLCPATFDRFRRALTEGKTFSLNRKYSFW